MHETGRTSSAHFAGDRLLGKLSKGGRIGLFCLISLLPTALYAQLSSQGNNSIGSQNGIEFGGQNGMGNDFDCSDPALADTPLCSGQSTGTAGSLSGSAGRSSMSSTFGTHQQNANGIYTDTENSQLVGSRIQLRPVKLPPEPLTEFQKFIASATGQVLPIFGANLFSTVPSTFAPLDMTPVPPDYVIGPGDELRIRVWGQVSFQANVRVDRTGEIFLPQVGPTHVAGIAFSALDAHLRGAISRVYRNFDLTVDVGKIRAIQVYISGEARRPGVYTVSSLSTLADALFASGGPSAQGSLRHIFLRRNGAQVADFDLYDLLIRGDKSKDAQLQSGDVIFIPPAGGQAAIVGSVRNPAIYELRAGETLAGILANAGGVTSVASEARVSIERVDDHRDRHAMEVSYDAGGLATSLTDGDLVRVYSILPQYQKTVILRGNIANPGRFAWHPGMRISELIPDRDSLVTRNYWWKRAQLGLPAAEFEPSKGLDDLRQPKDNHAVDLNEPGAEEKAQNPSGTQPETSGASANGAETSASPDLSAQQRSGNATLAAQRTSASPHIPTAAQRTEVRSLAPEIDWDYAVVERLDTDTLKTVLLPFDLGKLVQQHDASQDIELQAGDIVSVFSEADIHVPIAEQTKLITLGGEFVHAGTYTAQPGETLRHLVERAGGFTSSAYVFGSEFTRESTRIAQQSRLDEYIESLNMRMQRTNLAMAASAVTSAQDLAASAAGEGSENVLLASLRQIRATGRIVLKFTPDTTGTGSLPDVVLEDGDRFVVPSIPATVNVVGAIYDQNSFLYADGRRVGQYLQLAGGANRDADQKHEFLIRADGEVASRDRQKAFWGNEFDNLRIHPGDTIVVPEKTFKPTAMRGFLDWTQTFSQLALGAGVLTTVLP